MPSHHPAMEPGHVTITDRSVPAVRTPEGTVFRVDGDNAVVRVRVTAATAATFVPAPVDATFPCPDHGAQDVTGADIDTVALACGCTVANVVPEECQWCGEPANDEQGPVVREMHEDCRVAARRPVPGSRAATRPAPCPCECNSGGFCGGCGHAGCGRR